MDTLRAARLYYRLLPLPFCICMLFSAGWALFWSFNPELAGCTTHFFISLFFFLFVLLAGHQFDKLSLQFQISRRTQKKAFIAFLPAALLGAAANGLLTGASQRGELTEVYNTVADRFQNELLGKVVFSGNPAKIVLLSILLEMLTIACLMLLARVLLSFLKESSRKTKCIAAAVSICVLFLYWVAENQNPSYLADAIKIFLFGADISALSLFCARTVWLGVLALLYTLETFAELGKRTKKDQRKKRRSILLSRTAVICLMLCVNAVSVWYCSPVAVNICEYDRDYIQNDFVYDYSVYKKCCSPNEKAYRLLQAQERLASKVYRWHITKHMLEIYYVPGSSPDYTDYETGKRYYETYFALSEELSKSIRMYTYYAPHDGFSYSRSDEEFMFSSDYCRYLYAGGERDAALAFYAGLEKADSFWLPAHFFDLNRTHSYYENNFLWYLYEFADEQDALFAAKEMVSMVRDQTTLDTAENGIHVLSWLLENARYDAVREYLADAAAAYAKDVRTNLTPYANQSHAKETLTQLDALCNAAGV